MARNWNTTWRWIHIGFSTILIVYFARINYYHYGMFGVDETWSAEVDKIMATTVIWFVMWSGIAKWQLPRYKKWKRKRAKKNLQNSS